MLLFRRVLVQRQFSLSFNVTQLRFKDHLSLPAIALRMASLVSLRDERGRAMEQRVFSACCYCYIGNMSVVCYINPKWQQCHWGGSGYALLGKSHVILVVTHKNWVV